MLLAHGQMLLEYGFPELRLMGRVSFANIVWKCLAVIFLSMEDWAGKW